MRTAPPRPAGIRCRSMSTPRLAAALATIAIAACAAPSRPLPTRIVEDPIVLPRRMASVSMGATVVHYEPTDAQGVLVTPGFRFGITDRLEWIDLLGLRYAILDDRPADGRAPMPFSLALRAGLRGIGYSSLEGMIVLPVVSLQALKHIADRWALSLVGGLAGAMGRTWARIHACVQRRSLLCLAERVDRHAERGGDAAARQPGRARYRALRRPDTDCVDPTCGWESRSASAALVVGVRPWSWLTVSRARRRRSPPPGSGAADDLSGRHANHDPAADGDVGGAVGLAGLLLVIAASDACSPERHDRSHRRQHQRSRRAAGASTSRRSRRSATRC